MMAFTDTSPALNQAPRQTPELGRLKSAAERIARATNDVENFLVRFHGPQPERANEPKTDSDCYRNDLASVFSAIDRLEAAVSALDIIG